MLFYKINIINQVYFYIDEFINLYFNTKINKKYDAKISKKSFKTHLLNCFNNGTIYILLKDMKLIGFCTVFFKCDFILEKYHNLLSNDHFIDLNKYTFLDIYIYNDEILDNFMTNNLLFYEPNIIMCDNKKYTIYKKSKLLKIINI